jgi:LysR family transcriptional regulator, benzoate and cis,cis-muconate-responsive activator of ben and cat genes
MSRPDIRELECFVAVADHLNFSRAARQLHLSQPPLTRHIQALEEKTGARLFTRNTHSVALTDARRLFLEDARAVLARLDQAGDSLRRAQQGETARLRLAFVGALLDEKLMRLVQRFRENHPACQVQISDLPPAAQLDAIRDGQLDGGFIGAKPARLTRNIALVPWKKEPLVLALPERHPLAGVTPLRWQHLRELAWVMVSRSAAPAFRQQFAELAEKHGLRGRIVQESDRVPAILTLVAAGSGVTMVPQAVEHLLTSGIRFRRLPAPQAWLHHTFAHPSEKISPSLTNFLTLLRHAGRGTQAD